MCETAVSFSSCRCWWVDLWLICAIWLLSSVGSDGSPRSFTPSLGSCLGLSCFDLLVAQLEKAGPGFEWPNKTTYGTIVVDCTFILYRHSSDNVLFHLKYKFEIFVFVFLKELKVEKIEIWILWIFDWICVLFHIKFFLCSSKFQMRSKNKGCVQFL